MDTNKLNSLKIGQALKVKGVDYRVTQQTKAGAVTLLDRQGRSMRFFQKDLDGPVYLREATS